MQVLYGCYSGDIVALCRLFVLCSYWEVKYSPRLINRHDLSKKKRTLFVPAATIHRKRRTSSRSSRVFSRYRVRPVCVCICPCAGPPSEQHVLYTHIHTQTHTHTHTHTDTIKHKHTHLCPARRPCLGSPPWSARSRKDSWTPPVQRSSAADRNKCTYHVVGVDAGKGGADLGKRQ
jgi:N-acetylmuramoyl-L-alanine amidase